MYIQFIMSFFLTRTHINYAASHFCGEPKGDNLVRLHFVFTHILNLLLN